jgi:hypothetical protein
MNGLFYEVTTLLALLFRKKRIYSTNKDSFKQALNLNSYRGAILKGGI